MPLSPKVMAMLFGLFLFIALTAGPGIQRSDHCAAQDGRRGHGQGRLRLVMIGSIATMVLICGAIAQLAIGRLVERIFGGLSVRHRYRDRLCR